MNELNHTLHAYVRTFDRTTDRLIDLISHEAIKQHPIRYKVAYRLLRQILGIAKTICRLTKVNSEVHMRSVDDNCQTILSALRVLVESCNKFYYLAIDSKDEVELRIRWIFFSLVALQKYRALFSTIAAPGPDAERDKVYARIDKSILQHKAELIAAGVQNWQPFIDLGKDSIEGGKRQQRVLDGLTRDDYLVADYEAAISRRLNKNEKKHYQDLGNTAVHSSGLMLFFQGQDSVDGEELPLISQAACLALFNASRHLALCGLEMIKKFPELESLVDSKARPDWETMVQGVKQPDYQYD